MALDESSKVCWLNIDNGPGIDFAISNQPGPDQFAQPCGCFRVVLVVVG
jgi:hypothetical protein